MDDKSDVKKIITLTCNHGNLLQVGLSHAKGERRQFSLATTARVMQDFDLKVDKFIQDAACQFKPTIALAMPHLPDTWTWVTNMWETLSMGPFHLYNHNTLC